MVRDDLGATTAYGQAKAGGYTGTKEEWYNAFFEIISGDPKAPYDVFSDRPKINGITVSGDRTLSHYGIYDIDGGSYFRITGSAGDAVEINGVSKGNLDSTGHALIGGIIDVGTTIIKIGNVTKNIDTPYFGLYRVTK